MGELNGLIGLSTDDGLLDSVLFRGSVEFDVDNSLVTIKYVDGTWGTAGVIGVNGMESGFAYAHPNFRKLVEFAQRYNALSSLEDREVVDPFQVYRLTYVQLVGSIFERQFPTLVWGWADYKALVDGDLAGARFSPDRTAEDQAVTDALGWWNLPKSKNAISVAAQERVAARMAEGTLRVPICVPGEYPSSGTGGEILEAIVDHELYDAGLVSVPFASVGNGTRVSFDHGLDPWQLFEQFLGDVGCAPPRRRASNGAPLYTDAGYPRQVGEHIMCLLSMPLSLVQGFMGDVQAVLFDSIESYPIQASSWPGFMKKALGYTLPKFKSRKAADSIKWMSDHKASMYSKMWYKCAIDQLLSRATARRPRFLPTLVGFCNRPHLFATDGAVPGADKELVRSQLSLGEGVFEELRSKIALGYSYYEHELFAVIYCRVLFGYDYTADNFRRYRRDISRLYGVKADSIAPQVYLPDLDSGEGLSDRRARARSRGASDHEVFEDTGTEFAGMRTKVDLGMLKKTVEPNVLKYVTENPMWVISDKVNEKGVKRRTIVNPRLAMFMLLRWGYKIYLSYFGSKHFWSNSDFGPREVEDFMMRLNDEIICDKESEEQWSHSPMGVRYGLQPGDRVRECDTGRIGLVGRVQRTAEGEPEVVVLYPIEGKCYSSRRGLIEPLDVSGNDEFVVREYLDAFNEMMARLLRYDVVGSTVFSIMTNNDKWTEKGKREEHLQYWKSYSAEDLLRMHVYVTSEVMEKHFSNKVGEHTITGDKRSGVASGDPFTSELTHLLTAILQRCTPLIPDVNPRILDGVYSPAISKDDLRCLLSCVVRDGAKTVVGDWKDRCGTYGYPAPAELCLTIEEQVSKKRGFVVPERVLCMLPDRVRRSLGRSRWLPIDKWPAYDGPFSNSLEPLIRCEFDGTLLSQDAIGVKDVQNPIMPRVPPSGVGVFFGPGGGSANDTRPIKVFVKKTYSVTTLYAGEYYANLAAGDDAVLASTAERASAIIAVAIRSWMLRKVATKIQNAVSEYNASGHMPLKAGCGLVKNTRKLKYLLCGATVHPHKNYCTPNQLQFLSTNIIGGVVDDLARDIVFGDENISPVLAEEYHRKRLALSIGCGGIAAGDPSGIASSLIWGYDVSDPSLFRPDSKWFAIASKFTRYYDNCLLSPNLSAIAEDLVAAVKQYEIEVTWHGNWKDVPHLKRSRRVDKEIALLWLSTPRGPKYHGYGHFPWRPYGARFKWSVTEDKSAPYVHTSVKVEPMRRYVKEGMKLDIIRDDWKLVSFKRGKPAFDPRHLELHSDYYEWAASLHDDNFQPNKSESYSVVPLIKVPGISERVMADWYKRHRYNWYPNMHGTWRRQANAAISASLDATSTLVGYMKEKRFFHHAM